MKNQKIYEQITEQVINGLQGAKKWSKPWTHVTSAPHNGISGRAYSGINWLILALAPYDSPQWLTFNGVKELGGSVKGQKATQVIYYNVTKVKDKETGDSKTIPFAKPHNLFNVEQVEGVDYSKIQTLMNEYLSSNSLTNLQDKPETILDLDYNEFTAHNLAESLQVKLSYGCSQACFIPSADEIKMPNAEDFVDTAQFQATLIHELIHWTGHKSRLNRLGDKSKEGHAFEELVAELGAAMAGSIYGLPYEGLQHEEYIASWLTRLGDDPKHIYKAAKLAGKAVNYLIENSAVAAVKAA